MPEPLPSRLLPILVLLGAALLGFLAWRLFPAAQAWVAAQGCIAAGYTNCG